MISAMLMCQDTEFGHAVLDYIKNHGDFRLVERTDKGTVAIQATLGLTPDIVICEDLKELSCLDLLEATVAHAPNTWFLVCSVESSFDWLLVLMRAGARDVLPAPWSQSELNAALDRFLFRFSQHKQEYTAAHDAQLRRVLDKKFFEDTVVRDAGVAILADIPAIDYEYQISFIDGWFQAFNFLIDPRPKEVLQPDSFLPMLEMEALTREFFASRCDTLVCYVQDRGLSLLLNTALRIEDCKQLCREFLTACTQRLHWYQQPNTISIGVGLCSRHAEDIPQLVETAKFAGWMRLGAGKGRVLEYANYHKKWQPKHYYLSTDAADALRRTVRAKDEQSLASVIVETLGTAPDAGSFVATAISINDVLITAFNEIADAAVVENSKYLRIGKNIPPMVENLDTMEQIQRAVLQWASDCMQLLLQQTDSPESPAIAAAKRYLDMHYTEALRLEDVASVVRLTPAYFSMKFHQKTGKTFIEYLTRLRLEHAKELLCHSSQRINEIAAAVGFSDTRHFSRTFRRQYGLLPSEYRAQQNGASRNTNPGYGHVP